MRVQQHFWELREKRDRRELEKLKIKNPKLKLKKLNNLEFQEFWVPLKKIEGTVFSLEGREINLKKIWEIFEEYQEYYKEKQKFSFFFDVVFDDFVESVEAVSKVINIGENEEVATINIKERLKEILEEKKWRIFKKYFKKRIMFGSKRIFLFLGFKKVGTEVEISYFVGDTKVQEIKTDSRRFHRVPERAVAFLITLDGRDKVVPRYIFELP